MILYFVIQILQSFNQMNQMMTHPNINMNAQPGMHPSQTFSNTGGMHTVSCFLSIPIFYRIYSR